MTKSSPHFKIRDDLIPQQDTAKTCSQNKHIKLAEQAFKITRITAQISPNIQPKTSDQYSKCPSYSFLFLLWLYISQCVLYHSRYPRCYDNDLHSFKRLSLQCTGNHTKSRAAVRRVGTRQRKITDRGGGDSYMNLHEVSTSQNPFKYLQATDVNLILTITWIPVTSDCLTSPRSNLF